MRTTTRIAAACLALALAPTAARAQDGPARPWLKVASRDQRPRQETVFDGVAATPTPAPASTSAGAAPAWNYGDPYGFGAVLNQYRASAGLPPVAYDPTLSAWAGQNNAAQCQQGIGHHVNPNCLQNCGWNYSNAWEVARGWMDSAGHRRNMLSGSATRFGIAYGPGPYWTLNVR